MFFRDIGNVARHVLRLWFYLSPACTRSATMQEQMQDNPLIALAMQLNPWTWIFESYRNVIYDGTDRRTGTSSAACWSFSLVFLALATLFFKRLEPAFAKVL